MTPIELSKKEFHVLSALVGGETSGRELHKSLNDEVGIISGPGYYKLMARLKNVGYVEYRSARVDVNGHTVREHLYKITGHGQSAVRDTALYYATKGGLVDA